MELLNELVYILNRSGADYGDIISPASEAGKLIQAIAEGTITTDEEAAFAISGQAVADNQYTELKQQLIKTLTELVFNTNTTAGDSMNHQEFIFLKKKELMIAEKLLDQNVYHNAEKIILNVKEYAEKFQVIHLQIECVKLLRTVYTMKGSPKEVEFYNVVLKKLTKFFQYEQDALGFIDLLESKAKFFIGKYKEIAIEANRYSMQIREWQKESTGPALKLYRYRIDLITCYHTNDVREWRFILDRITDIANGFTFLRTEALALYLDIEWAKYMRCTANITGMAHHLQKALHQSSYAAFNKFDVQALHFDLKIKEKNYTGAGDILLDVKQCLQFHLLGTAEQAAWFLREAYLCFILLALNDKQALHTYSDFFSGTFSVSALLHACKLLSDDKKGYNFMLLIIKESLLKINAVHDNDSKADDLLAYYQKHIKDACEERSKNFIKKFAKAMKHGFSNETKIKITAKNFDACELIPYEDLFDLLAVKKTNTLKKNKPTLL